MINKIESALKAMSETQRNYWTSLVLVIASATTEFIQGTALIAGMAFFMGVQFFLH